jgi:ABC-type sugar transport system ATPase subunit
MSGLVVRNLSKSFGDKKVLQNISLELKKGELLVLLGPSGCGKSTLLRIIAGLEQADTGEVYVGERRIDLLQPRDRDVALVFQNYALYPHMSVEKNIAFPLKTTGVKKQERDSRTRKVAETLGLLDILKDRPGTLSGGERQRVALGRAIIREPALFLLDEPLSNLDAHLRTRMRREIVDLQKRLQRTTIHVTHDQTEALTMADRVALMDNGAVVQLGAPQELYESPNCLFAAEFMGRPKINIIEACIDKNLLLPFGLSTMNQNLQRSADKILLGLRSEAIEIRPDAEYLATAHSCEYHGDRFAVALTFKETQLVASSMEAVQPGTAVKFGFEPSALMFFDASTGQRLDNN